MTDKLKQRHRKQNGGGIAQGTGIRNSEGTSPHRGLVGRGKPSSIWRHMDITTVLEEGSGCIFFGAPPFPSAWLTCGYHGVMAPVTTRVAAPGREAKAPAPAWRDPPTASCSPDMSSDICGCWAQALLKPQMAHLLPHMCWGRSKATFPTSHSTGCHSPARVSGPAACRVWASGLGSSLCVRRTAAGSGASPSGTQQPPKVSFCGHIFDGFLFLPL